MSKRYKVIEEVDGSNELEEIIGLAIGAVLIGAGLVALFYAAVVGVPLIIGGVLAYGAWKSWRYSPAEIARREVATIRELHQSVRYLADRVELVDPDELTDTVIFKVEDELDRPVPEFLHEPIREAVGEVIRNAGLEAPPEFDAALLQKSADARNAYRRRLEELREVYGGGSAAIDAVYDYLVRCVGEVCASLPEADGLTVDPGPDDLTIPLLEALDEPARVVDVIARCPFRYESQALAFEQNRMLNVFARISGKRVSELLENPQRIPDATHAKDEARTVVKTFLAGSPFQRLFHGRVGFTIPADARFEHMHILAGTGHGKTQLIQKFVWDDLQRAYIAARRQARGEDFPARSCIVIDGQGDLIRTIARTHLCHPGDYLGDRIIIVDPTETPLALNMFDLGREGIERAGHIERELVYNGTIELYVYLFGALLGAELTQKQDVLFRFVARLMLEIPGATLETLRDVIENGERYQSHIDQLDHSAREFFRTQFFGKEFDDTKQQLLRRLWGVLSNATLSTMFNSPVNKIDLYSAMQDGSIILINTAKDYLKTDGARIFGRFWIAMIAQAALRRAALPASARVDTHVYVDEAHEYIDDKVEEILNQARKYRVGLALAHQNRAQLSQTQRATLASSTGIKMVGGVSEQDARGYAGDLRVTPELIMSARKFSGGAEFVTYVRNHTPSGIKLNVPFGVLEGKEKLDRARSEELRDRVRERYGIERGEAFAGPPRTPPPPSDGPEEGDFPLGKPEAL